MTRGALDRLYTVRGAARAVAFRPVVQLWTTYADPNQYGSMANFTWYASKSGTPITKNLAGLLSADKLHWAGYWKDSDGANQYRGASGLAALNLGSGSKVIQLVDTGGNALLRWTTAEFVRQNNTSGLGQGDYTGFQAAVVRDSDLTPESLAIGAGRFTFSSYGAHVSSAITAKRVWGKLHEEGEASGLVRLTANLSGVNDIATATQVRASFTMRYDPALRFVSEVVEGDLVWQASSSYVTDDYRFIVAELFRDVLQPDS